jgi:hypothetical protein
MLQGMDLSYTHTLEIPKTLKRTLENPKTKPRGLSAKLVHFWTKVQKPCSISILSHLVHKYVDL